MCHVGWSSRDATGVTRVQAFKHPTTNLVFDYWVSLNGGRPPEARLLDPVAIPKLMSNLLVLERTDGGAFIHRFAGTGVCEFVGMELTGVALGKYLPASMLASAELNLVTILEHPCGRWNTSTTRSATGRVSEVEYLSLPLCDGQGVPDRIMVFMAVLDTQGFGPTTAKVEERVASEWIDLGSGTPRALDIQPEALNAAL